MGDENVIRICAFAGCISFILLNISTGVVPGGAIGGAIGGGLGWLLGTIINAFR